MYSAYRSDKSTPPSSVDERVPSLLITLPAAQLQHLVTFCASEEPSAWADDDNGVESVVE
jgi:hypothetical protein